MVLSASPIPRLPAGDPQITDTPPHNVKVSSLIFFLHFHYTYSRTSCLQTYVVLPALLLPLISIANYAIKNQFYEHDVQAESKKVFGFCLIISKHVFIFKSTKVVFSPNKMKNGCSYV